MKEERKKQLKTLASKVGYLQDLEDLLKISQTISFIEFGRMISGRFSYGIIPTSGASNETLNSVYLNGIEDSKGVISNIIPQLETLADVFKEGYIKLLEGEISRVMKELDVLVPEYWDGLSQDAEGSADK